MIRHGFTLFEVGISLLIMTIAVTTALMLLPAGIQAQQTSRAQMLAAAKALSIAGSMTSRVASAGTTCWHEGMNLVDGANVNAGSRMPDLHQFSNSLIDGIGQPLPTTIARRIDSDGDEIAEILDQGGTIFYSPAFTVNSFDWRSASAAGLNTTDLATRRLIFGFRGDPQQNALINHPQTMWPYPSIQPGAAQPWEAGVWSAEGISAPGPDDYVATSATLVGLGLTVPLGGTPDPATYGDNSQFAVMCLALRDHAYASLKRATPPLAAGVIAADAETQARIDHAWMEHFLIWAQVNRPDNCRIPRMMNRALMCDVPLLHFDCFATPETSNSYPVRRPEGPWRIWPVLSERPMSYTRSWTYDNVPTTTAGSSHFNLTAPFAPAERCRQMVMWGVDWQSYEDAETAAAAPMDSSLLHWRPISTSGSEFQQLTYGMRMPPELFTHFTDASRTATFGFTGLWGIGNGGDPPARQYLGRHGVDRNRNGVCDIGATKASVRMRATTIARFNLYDPRGYVCLR